MDLFFSPMACSMASKIVIREAGGEVTLIEVDPKTKKTLDGADFYAINPQGLVPVLRNDDGQLLTENTAILQYLAEQYPAAKLAPTDRWQGAQLRQWLSFVSTELHKGVFAPLFSKKLSEDAKAVVLEGSDSRLRYLNSYLAGREFLLDRFSVADAYLFTILNWNIATPVDLTKYPAIASYYRRLKHRPSIAQVLAEDSALYAAEIKRHKVAA
jgi:glutathione S-transferase